MNNSKESKGKKAKENKKYIGSSVCVALGNIIPSFLFGFPIPHRNPPRLDKKETNNLFRLLRIFLPVALAPGVPTDFDRQVQHNITRKQKT